MLNNAVLLLIKLNKTAMQSVPYFIMNAIFLMQQTKKLMAENTKHYRFLAAGIKF